MMQCFDLSVPHKIAVLMGGWSPERDVSLVSGRDVANALKRGGHEVHEIEVGRDVAAVLDALAPTLCFNALHGVGGEDGTIQGVLEVLEIPYTHSGVCASALAMDKLLSKQIFAQKGLPLAKGLRVTPGEIETHPLPPPYVAKPINQGSSVGVAIVKSNNEALPDNLAQAGAYGDMLVEAYVAGRELTCAIIDDAPSCVLEIIPREPFYDYGAKYDEGGSVHRIAEDLEATRIAEIQEISLAAHHALGCRGITRADFRYDSAKAELVLLEINTQPGMTPVSLVPEMAAYGGVSYDALVQKIAEDASCQR